MKKILAMALLALVLTACGKSKTEQLVDVLNEATEQISKATDLAAMKKVEDETQVKINRIVGDQDNYKPDEKDVALIQPAMDKYYKAFYEKGMELGEIDREAFENIRKEAASPQEDPSPEE